MPTKKSLIFLLLFIPYLLTSCDSSSKSTTPPSNESSASIPKVETFEYAELKGREGHKGFFPIEQIPVAGKMYLIVTTIGDVSSLSVNITSDTNTSESYSANKPDQTEKNSLDTIDDDFNKWIVEINLPTGESTIQTVMTTSTDKEYISISEQKVKTNSINIELSRSDLNFSPGPNSVTAKITNYDKDTEFLVSASDNYDFVKGQFLPTTYAIKKGESISVEIPVNLQKKLEANIYDYQISIQVVNQNSKESNSSKMDLKIKKSATGISDKYKLIVVNPESCSHISRSNETVEIMIVGSEKLFLNNVNFDSIILMNGKLKPLTTSLEDKVSFHGYDCNDMKADGIIDLVMIFSLKDIIQASDANGASSNISAYIVYNTSDFGGDVLEFNLSVGD